MIPAPSISSVVAHSAAAPRREGRAAETDSGVWIPLRPRHEGTAVNLPRIIRGDVNDLGTSRLNDDGRVLGRYGLLLRSLKIARFLSPLAHHLYGVHQILFLVEVSVA